MVETIEPCVIEEDLIRSCVKISGPIEAKEDKSKQIALREVDTLICSFWISGRTRWNGTSNVAAHYPARQSARDVNDLRSPQHAADRDGVAGG